MDSIEPNDSESNKIDATNTASDVVVADDATIHITDMTSDSKPENNLPEPAEEILIALPERFSFLSQPEYVHENTDPSPTSIRRIRMGTPEPKPEPETVITPEPQPEPETVITHELQPEPEPKPETQSEPEVTQVFVIEEFEPINVCIDDNNVQSENESHVHGKTESFETIAITSVDSPASDSHANAIQQTQIQDAPSGNAASTSPLIDLFVSILKAQNPELNNLNFHFSLTLDKETTNCLLFILNSHPDYFSDFGKLLSLILEDGKINLADVPYISLLVSKTYEFVHHFKKNIKHINDEKTFEVCANIMKTVFHVLVMNNVIVFQNQVDGNKETLMTTFDSVVDSCVSLVKLNHVLNNKGCTCFSFFSKSKPKAEPKPVVKPEPVAPSE